MAHGSGMEWSGRIKCSYKTATMVICAGNLVVALYVLHSLLTPLYIITSSSLAGPANDAHLFQEDEVKRMREAIKVRQASQPVDLIRRVKEIEEESYRKDVREKRSQSTTEKLAQELLQRLNEFKGDGDSIEQQALEEWRKKKLEEVKKREAMKASVNSSMHVEDTEMVAKVLETDWGPVLEKAGFSLSPEASSEDSSGKMLEDGPEIEDGIIPGRPLPSECHAEPHTDYDGAAVKWGLMHHKESAADCCQACLDQAKNAKEGEKKCNIWVYCPFEPGCYSPDIYQHKHQECWLKQVEFSFFPYWISWIFCYVAL